MNDYIKQLVQRDLSDKINASRKIIAQIDRYLIEAEVIRDDVVKILNDNPWIKESDDKAAE